MNKSAINLRTAARRRDGGSARRYLTSSLSSLSRITRALAARVPPCLSFAGAAFWFILLALLLPLVLGWLFSVAPDLLARWLSRSPL